MGRSRLLRDGKEVELPPPLPFSVLKLLVLNGGTLHGDEIAMQIWHDEEVAISRPRVRNVLSKIRRPTGLRLAQRNGTVSLLDTVHCDLTDYLNTATHLLTAWDNSEIRARLLPQLTKLWEGTPLEENRFEQWANAPRSRAVALRSRVSSLVSDPQGGDPGPERNSPSP